MNTICLIGRLTADPELKHTASQIPVTSFTVAVDRKTKDKQTDFINIVAWRGTAEFASKHFRKGVRMGVQGELQQRQYTDKDSNKRTVYEVVASSVYFADGRTDSKPDVSVKDYEEISVNDDDLPF